MLPTLHENIKLYKYNTLQHLFCSCGCMIISLGLVLNEANVDFRHCIHKPYFQIYIFTVATMLQVAAFLLSCRVIDFPKKTQDN